MARRQAILQAPLPEQQQGPPLVPWCRSSVLLLVDWWAVHWAPGAVLPPVGPWAKKLFGSDDSLKQMPAAGPLMMRNAGQNIPPVMGDIAKSFQSGQTPPLMGQAARSLASPAPSASTSSLLKPAEPFTSAAPPAIEQQFSFAPYLAISVQGDVRDPAQLARELEPYLRFQFDEYSRQAAGRQLFDAAHV